MRERQQVNVRGIVQGVGFRPYIHGLARRHALVGHVCNDAAGVHIEVEGESADVRDFVQSVGCEAPPLAEIDTIDCAPLPLCGEPSFEIGLSPSSSAAGKHAFISPDVTVCEACLHEMNDPADRRYAYPFINCTHCGPRFTIIKDVPYDRPGTTMAPFTMCALCRAEYEDPASRRFHAQPNACPQCGPALMLVPSPAPAPAQNKQLSPGRHPQVAIEIGRADGNTAPLQLAAQLLAGGSIVAIKGLGGYHLACDAANEEAVKRLRAAKQRDDKPFALMVPTLQAARVLCEVDDDEAELLTSRARPVVLLNVRVPLPVAAAVAPHHRHLGVMLPYTPMHYLLLQAFAEARCAEARDAEPAARPEAGDALVMTSGNLSDEPICYRDDEAQRRLAPLVDAFLLHDRAIYMRCDDSVARIVRKRPFLLRRSRGYAPVPVPVEWGFSRPLLATGAHLKNTFCLAKDRHAFVSHHIGDLENYETYRSFTTGIEHFKRFFDVAPQVVACDMHPEYLATKYALERYHNCALVAVQHHHAHVAAAMGEACIGGPVIGVAFDGTGYGADGTLWGGEFLVADIRTSTRAAHLQTLPLIGGAQAIKQVWRLAAAWLHQVYGDEFVNLDLDFVRNLDGGAWKIMRAMLDKGLNTPRSSAVGRLFDAVAALLGVRTEVTYEGQAAIELEAMADSSCDSAYRMTVAEGAPWVIETAPLLRAIVADLAAGAGHSVIAARFNNGLSDVTVEVCQSLRAENGLNQVVLTGGVFQNQRLLRRTWDSLEQHGFEVVVPTRLPVNDGGISFGQALVADAVTRDMNLI